jgi:P-type Ca2+ transporter type 2C
MVSAG